ncbi:hypothetical protein XCR1_60012 [Xenorhabdus cabanillasii JM26]|uniref:Uncharacterized protein n=1 Tax=Xenorhabdus cabanillasii JM26 TaxID=1427517 RepID=W1JB72_9GAMM|nr:hypothetical protein XCR1_60012 [Xenorhabdus cabanillasii JM26]
MDRHKKLNEQLHTIKHITCQLSKTSFNLLILINKNENSFNVHIFLCIFFYSRHILLSPIDDTKPHKYIYSIKSIN